MNKEWFSVGNCAPRSLQDNNKANLLRIEQLNQLNNTVPSLHTSLFVSVTPSSLRDE